MSLSRGGSSEGMDTILKTLFRTLMVLVRGRTLFGHYLSSVGKDTILFFWLSSHGCLGGLG